MKTQKYENIFKTDMCPHVNRKIDRGKCKDST